MKIEKIKLSEIKANPSNPRVIRDEKFEKLCKSIEDLPEMLKIRPIVLNDDNIVLGGNMRLRALQHLGFKETYVIYAKDLTPEQQKEFIIKDNVGYGDWDWSLIANDFPEAEEWGLDVPVFKEQKQGEDDDFDVPDGGAETDIIEGDIFEIGQHRLLCGSSTQTDTWKRLMGDELADLVITDPTYNVAIQGGNHGDPARTTGKKIKNDSMSDSEFYQFLYDFYTALGSFTKSGGVWYVWYASKETINFHKAMIDSGLTPKQDLIWLKSSIVMGRQDYQWKHEPCIYGWKEGAAHGWYSDRKQTTVLNFDRPQRNAEHPTMKPIPLIAYQMGNSSKEGDIVCDGFGGSGTTMLAAEQLNRKCRMIELDPKYCQVIIDRMVKLNPTLIIKKNGVIIK